MHSYTVKFLRTLQAMMDNSTPPISLPVIDILNLQEADSVIIAVIYTMSMLISTHAFYNYQ